ncbi:MAG: hypothetical protein PHI45_02560 [Candidatus Pacebacteria bacterium]|jgi:hypothetical protein|nr:hypothetical protein [Candidatus Paceibacterota bacterium]MDD5013059.1 hypothetical protein [Candidatus Paceibacterota bacterium]MDD5752941.1 hypothetical protein [Candidatus Paceibacterota bacterium]
MNQRGFIKILGIGIVIIIAVAVSGFISNKVDEQKELFSSKEETEKQEEGNNQSIEEINNKQSIEESLEEDPKVFFRATEIITNHLPASIEFWTEAYCPDEETPYNYVAPEGYSVYSCDKNKQEMGTHGGCSTCVMSSIKLTKNYLIYSAGFNCEYPEKYECPVVLLEDKDFSDLEKGMSLEIFNSKEKLKKYIEERVNIEFEQVLIRRGSFDKYSNNQIAIISFCKDNCKINFEDGLKGLSYKENKGFNDFLIITEKEDKSFKIFYFSTHSVIRDANNFSIDPIELISSEKPFFIGSRWGCGSSSFVGCSTEYYLFRVIDGELIQSYELISVWEGSTYKGNEKDGYVEEKVFDSVKTITFENIDSDEDKEIIFEKEKFNGNPVYDENYNITNKEEVNFTTYQVILDWSRDKKQFLSTGN